MADTRGFLERLIAPWSREPIKETPPVEPSPYPDYDFRTGGGIVQGYNTHNSSGRLPGNDDLRMIETGDIRQTQTGSLRRTE